MNTSWTRRQAAERGQAVRRFAAFAFAALVLVATLPAHAFQKTSFADGSFEYFFAAPSLDIRSTGDLDLSGLSFIEGVDSGFRVGALFDLDWLDGERAWLATPASTWSGIDTLPRSLSIISGGNIDFGTVRLSLPGGNISLAAGGNLNLGGGSVIATGGSDATIIGSPGFAVPPPPTAGGVMLTIGKPGDNISIIAPPLTTPLPSVVPMPIVSGGAITLRDLSPIAGGAITISGPSPIPEPSTSALLLAGLLGLAGMFGRRARAGR